jgi:hypothetical protein
VNDGDKFRISDLCFDIMLNHYCSQKLKLIGNDDLII